MTAIKQEDLIQSVADAFQYISYYHPLDYIKALGEAYEREMSAYLDSDSQRRQSGTVLRLTVVTIFGLIAAVVTGYFGMNLFSFPEVPESRKLLQFGVVTVVTLSLVLFAVARSKRLSDFLEAMSDERLDGHAKWSSLARVFRKPEH